MKLTEILEEICVGYNQNDPKSRKLHKYVKEVVDVLKALNIANNKVLLVSEDEKVLQGSRNLNNVLVVSKNNISVYDLLNSETLVMVEADVKELEEGLK